MVLLFEALGALRDPGDRQDILIPSQRKLTIGLETSFGALELTSTTAAPDKIACLPKRALETGVVPLFVGLSHVLPKSTVDTNQIVSELVLIPRGPKNSDAAMRKKCTQASLLAGPNRQTVTCVQKSHATEGLTLDSFVSVKV